MSIQREKGRGGRGKRGGEGEREMRRRGCRGDERERTDNQRSTMVCVYKHTAKKEVGCTGTGRSKIYPAERGV